MLKKRSFWVGVAVGLVVGFLYGWFGIWSTYTALEAQSKAREADLDKIKRILFLGEDLRRERAEIVEWNQNAIQPRPTVVVVAEEEQ